MLSRMLQKLTLYLLALNNWKDRLTRLHQQDFQLEKLFILWGYIKSTLYRILKK